MGLREARKYITALHKRQEDPMCWPDYLTGLPDNHAIIKVINDVYPKLGTYSIAYIRINNINTYLVKYGTDKHAEILQWAAGILKTTADRCGGFVGVFGNFDFVAVCKKKEMPQFLGEASRLFSRKTRTFYSKKDLERNTVLSFKRDGKLMNLGFMEFIYSTLDEKTDIPREYLLSYLEKLLSPKVS